MIEGLEVDIRQRISAEGHPFSEVFINYAGRRFYSRHWFTIPDTPHSATNEAQQFLQRLKRFPSTVAQTSA